MKRVRHVGGLCGFLAPIFALGMGACIAAAAPVTVSIGNGTQSADGSYVNAQNIADNLALTNVLVQATNEIDIVDNINLSTSIYGTPAYNLGFAAPTVNLNYSIQMSYQGYFYFSGPTINLAGTITSGGLLLDPSRYLHSNVTQANVLSNTASVQQAIDVCVNNPSSTVQISTGQYNENVLIYKTLNFATSSPAGHVNNASLSVASGVTAVFTGSGFTNASGGTVGGAGTLDVSALTSGFVNHGTISPGMSPGLLSLTGDYSQAGDGDFEIEIGGTTAGSQYDRLAVSDNATLDGLLHVSLIDGFTPSAADSFTILTAGSRSGIFSDAITSIPAGSGLFDVTYTPTSVVLGNFHPAPEPGGAALLSAGLLRLLVRRRRRER